MTKKMNRHLLITTILWAAMLPAAAHQEAAIPPQLPAIGRQTLLTGLDDAMAVYYELKYLALASRLTADDVRYTAEMIRPHCLSLGQLPPETRHELIMLADAVLWQGKWMNDTYLEERGVVYRYEIVSGDGLDTLERLSEKCKQLLTDTETEPELISAIQEVLQILGGPEMLNRPEKLLQHRWAKDYKTALVFFKELCAAASQQDEQTALAALREQREVLEYFQSGGKWETMRVNALANQFRDTLVIAGTFKHPFGSTVVPAELRSAARMQALAPFLEALPNLTPLLLQPLEYEQK